MRRRNPVKHPRPERWTLEAMSAKALKDAGRVTAYAEVQFFFQRPEGPVLFDAKKAVEENQTLDWVATVVNHVTMKPYFVTCVVTESFDLQGAITVPTSKPGMVLMGNGYLDTHDPGHEYLAVARQVDLPRVHTLGGVAFRGEGLGTSLYVGMAAVATYLHETTVEGDLRRPPFSGPGVCSGPSASDSARRWWHKAAETGLAETANRMTFARPLSRYLVLDLNPNMGKWSKRVVDYVDGVVSLDLSEVEDPLTLTYFYELAFRHGATLDQVATMRSRAEANRPKKTRVKMQKMLEDVAATGLAHRGIDRLGLHKHGVMVDRLAALAEQPVVRPNPAPDYREIAASLYPNLVGLDD